MDRISLLRRLRKAKNERIVHVELNPTQHKANIVDTPLLEADQSYLLHMAAPSLLFDDNGMLHESKAFMMRSSKFFALYEQITRYLHSKREVAPIMTDVGLSLSLNVAESTQKQIADNWPVTTKKKAAHESLKNKVDLRRKELMNFFRKQEHDDDVFGYTFTSDNVGSGKNIRYETTTQHVQIHRFSSLPPSVQTFTKDEAKKGEWVSMPKAGIESSEDLVASQESDDLQRLMVI